MATVQDGRVPRDEWRVVAHREPERGKLEFVLCNTYQTGQMTAPGFYYVLVRGEHYGVTEQLMDSIRAGRDGWAEDYETVSPADLIEDAAQAVEEVAADELEQYAADHSPLDRIAADIEAQGSEGV